MNLIDLSLPIYNGMWHYRPGWENSVREIESVLKGGNVTIYGFDLCSHTGTYIETSHHKLKEEIMLSDFKLSDFYRTIKFISIETDALNIITLQNVLSVLKEANLKIEKNDSVVICSGYGKEHRNGSYLKNAPSFSEDLTAYLCDKKISFLGTDSPMIENSERPYQPVVKLFTANPEMLVLGPLMVETSLLKTGIYQLSCFPLSIERTSACLCRAVLIVN